MTGNALDSNECDLAELFGYYAKILRKIFLLGMKQ